MLRNTLLTLAALVALGPPAANAWPLGHVLHLHPAKNLSQNVSFRLYNGSQTVRQLAIGDQQIVLQPNSIFRVSALPGTAVTVAANDTRSVLFSVQPSLRDNTVVIH